MNIVQFVHPSCKEGNLLADTVERINNIGFEIRATLRPTASIEILCHDQAPFLILPDPDQPDEFIRYSGHYTLEGGAYRQKIVVPGGMNRPLFVWSQHARLLSRRETGFIR